MNNQIPFHRVITNIKEIPIEVISKIEQSDEKVVVHYKSKEEKQFKWKLSFHRLAMAKFWKKYLYQHLNEARAGSIIMNE
jgi:hypothetical protein